MIIMMKRVFLLLPILLIACQSDEENKEPPKNNEQVSEVKTTEEQVFQAINKPFESFGVAFHEYIYNSGKTNVIDFHTGSKITIPNAAFVDKNGNEVTKGIKILYREFHSVAEIIASGINMNYKDGSFESAGMFEIRAFKDDKELQLKDGKSIQVDLASYKNEDGFGNYYMNEKKGWSSTPDGEILPNEDKKTQLAELKNKIDSLEKVCVIKPQIYNPQKDQIIDLNLESHIYDELGFLSDAMWKIIDEGDQFDKVKYGRVKWTNMQLEPKECNSYTVKLDNWTYANRDNKTEVEFEAEPVWSEVIIKDKMDSYGKRKNELDRSYREKMIKRKQHAKEADILRTFNVNNMGIWNSDRIINREGYLAFHPKFNFPEELETDIAVFLIVNESFVIKYYSPHEEMKIDPKQDNCLMAVLNGDRVVKIESNDVKAVFAENNYNIKGKSIAFNFNYENATECKSVNDLQNLVAAR